MSLAYFTAGDGVPFVKIPTTFEHIQLLARERDDAGIRAIAARMRYVAYDARGAGLSTREVPEFSMEAALCDLDTIVRTLRLSRFALFGNGPSGPVAIRYAVEHPENVSHLVLMDTAARVSDLWPPRVRSMHAMLTAAPDLYFQTIADLAYGRGSKEANELAAILAQSGDPHTAKRALEAQASYDVTDLLPFVTARTLIIRGLAPISPIEASMALAASIPEAQLVTLPPASLTETMVNTFVEMIRFLEADGTLPAAAASSRPTRLHTVLFTDLVGHTEMMRRLGDERGRAVLREHERITRDLLKQHGGTEVKTMGDGFMASFGSVAQAVDCAIALQRAFAEHAGEPLQIRVGLNAGEPIEEDGDLFGSTVIMASRVCAQAGAGEILVPEPVRHLLTGKPYVYADRGETILKGFEDAVRLYEVRWHE